MTILGLLGVPTAGREERGRRPNNCSQRSHLPPPRRAKSVVEMVPHAADGRTGRRVRATGNRNTTKQYKIVLSLKAVSLCFTRLASGVAHDWIS